LKVFKKKICSDEKKFFFHPGLFLDNTFCDPKYLFPPQTEAIQSILDIVRKEVKKKKKKFQKKNFCFSFQIKHYFLWVLI
jgi:hypothetical protein